MIGINHEPGYKEVSENNKRNNLTDINEARKQPPLIEGVTEGSICEAVNCFLPAAIKINVDVGQLGSISLSLCNDCVAKFRDEA